MFHLVTGYFTWDLLAWSAIFFFSALFLVQLLRFKKKRLGLFVSDEQEDEKQAPKKWTRCYIFIDDALRFWFEMPQAQLLLFAVILFFFAIAVLGVPAGGDAI